MSAPNFHLHIPSTIKHPIIISAPHVGTAFPEELRGQFRDDILEFPIDCDWLVHELYRDIADDLGLIMIWAKYSRYLVDLNRDPVGGALYNDGRKETSVVPFQTFSGEPIYKTGTRPDHDDIKRRVLRYHQPYYEKITELIERLRQQHSHVLFYDAHSIRRHVPTIRQEPFPDMILGTNEGRSATEHLASAALAVLQSGDYEVRRDEIFKGGYLTRYFGRPEKGIHALQLERSWDTYLQDDPRELDIAKSSKQKALLRRMMDALADQLSKLNDGKTNIE